ncbi:MAG TPA: DUF4349 domain-containing protein, partial [Chitinophagales bacterium]|nr:DUF4349 domain-containing protein [Chitinophagales bacterium]
CQKSNDGAIQSKDAVGLSSPQAESASSDAVTNSTQPIPTQHVDTNVQRMLTKEGNLSWETSNVDKTHASIVAQAKKSNAYISSDNRFRDEYQMTNKMSIRIPSNQFDNFISSIENDVNNFDEKRIEVIDVTEEYIDVSARMKTKKELELHYYDLLKQTKNVTEILQVEEQLNIVRSEIESAEGRLKYLKDKVNMSTIHLSFYETTSAPVGFFGQIGKSFVAGWKGMLYFILGLITAWPIVLIVLITIWLVIRRRNNQHKK